MKATLRHHILQKRKTQPFSVKKKKNAAIYLRLAHMALFQNARVVFTYVSKEDEVDTHQILQKYCGRKKIVVPRVRDEKHLELFSCENKTELAHGAFGILEPHHRTSTSHKSAIDLALIPGIVFDPTGHRIGFGKGYFDRFLKKLHCQKIGLAYEFQIVDKISATAYDVPVDYIVTEKRIIRCRKK